MNNKKNVWLIPTDKPSRLWINNLLQGKLELSKEVLVGSNTAQSIYITDDSEVKEGDWVFNLKSKGVYSIFILNEVVNYEKKIILTTDQDSIADGVQAIDDEFLEWFVKNPSCEEVKIYLVELCDNCGQQHCDNGNCRGYKDEKFYLISTSENTTERVITYCDGYKVKEL